MLKHFLVNMRKHVVCACEVNRMRPYLFVPTSDFHKGEVKFLLLVIKCSFATFFDLDKKHELFIDI